MRILFVDPYESNIYNFRKELLERLIEDGHEVFLATNYSNRINNEYLGKVAFCWTKCNLQDKTIIKNIKLLLSYKRIIRNIHPDIILSFTIKPNIYCSFFSKKIPIISNITGLGRAFGKKSILTNFVKIMYKRAFRHTDYVFFQNSNGYETFVENKIPINQFKIIPGSGVNLTKFIYSSVEPSNYKRFLFASRFIKEKGIGILLDCIPPLLEKQQNAIFTFVGTGDDKYLNIVNDYANKWPNNVFLCSWEKDMLAQYKLSTFIVSPSFYNEGVSNVLLESLAVGRPIITTNDNPGCMELLNGNLNGIGVKSNDVKSLFSALERACFLNINEINSMGKEGRKMVEEKYNRELVIQAYLDVISDIKCKYVSKKAID